MMLDVYTPGLHFAALSAFITLTIATLLTLVKYSLASRRPRAFPRGPPTLPLLGNLHQLPSTKFFLRWHEWRKEYGDIIGLKFGTSNVIILNNYKAVRDLFDKRGAIYASRPPNHVGNEILCPGDVHVLFVPYGEGWRKLRKPVQQLLNVTAVDNMLPVQSAEGTQTLHDILVDPDNYFDHIRRYTSAVIMASVYGQRGASFSSSTIKRFYAVQDRFANINEPGAVPPVDEYPILKYLPEFLAPWKREARTIRKEQYAVYSQLLEVTKAKIAQGLATDCFMAKLLRMQEKSGLNDDQVIYTGGILMEAGSDTTAVTLLSFCLAMIAHPEVLQKCQDEVDQICIDRTPNIEDVGKLPYLKACMFETLRWRPILAGGVPHVSTEDDVYGDYHIPKGTILFANVWGIHMDESEFEKPVNFQPERFLQNRFGTKHGEDGDNENRRISYAFGAGRRVCAGQRLAENALMMNMAKLVWTFNITSPVPVDISMETGFTGGLVQCPHKFPAKFTARSEMHAAIVEREYKDADLFLQQFE